MDCSTIVASNLLASLDRLLWVRLWGPRTLGGKLDPIQGRRNVGPFHALNFEKKSALKTSVFQSRIWCRLVQIDEKGEWVCAKFKACAVPGCEHRTPHAGHFVQKPAVRRSGCDTCEARVSACNQQAPEALAEVQAVETKEEELTIVEVTLQHADGELHPS